MILVGLHALESLNTRHVLLSIAYPCTVAPAVFTINCRRLGISVRYKKLGQLGPSLPLPPVSLSPSVPAC